jgi:phosphoribosylglycinamide formyltransferase 2
VQKAWDYAAAGGRVNQGRVIVEGFIDFDYEITQLTVRACDASGAVQTYFCDPIGHVQVSGDYVESWQPQAMSPAALARSREIAGAVTANLGGRGLFGVELFVKGDRCGSRRSARGPTTPAWSPCAPSAPSSSCTPAPSSACRWM